MFSLYITLLVVISLSAVGILAVDDNCPTPYNGSPIESCCDLNKKPSQFAFGEFNTSKLKPRVYKLKHFCNKTCTTLIINGYCDTVTDGGGWLVVQRRMSNGSVSFHRNWNDYEMGFGNLTSELWYGLRALHCLTSSGNWELRIDFTFDNGTKSFMHYNHFRVGPANDNYRLNISGFTGITPDDPFTTHPLNGQQFSTYDRDNDRWSNSCAVNGHGSTAPGGWWYSSCFRINLNYNHGGPRGFIKLANIWYSLTFIEMKIRPSNCEI